MSTSLPIVFRAGGRLFVTDPTADPSKVRAQIRRAQRRGQLVAGAALLGVSLIVTAISRLAPGGVVYYLIGGLGAVLLWTSVAWLLDSQPRHVGDALDLSALIGQHAGARETVRALRDARRRLRAHMALYDAAEHANAARVCAAVAQRVRQHIDHQELVTEADERRALARAALDEAYAACTGGDVIPWAKRIAARATAPASRRRG